MSPSALAASRRFCQRSVVNHLTQQKKTPIELTKFIWYKGWERHKYNDVRFKGLSASVSRVGRVPLQWDSSIQAQCLKDLLSLPETHVFQ
mmetsp:Transcript_9813/g.36617  ORF Transcript_9813/g.36617 Transcript_9813/m.36617 type:complete len:90 (-) Transcript_9813:381-650(-)